MGNDTSTMSKYVQDAVGGLLGVIAKGVAENPKLAQEDKMATLVEGAGGAFTGIAGKIQVGDNQQLAARSVGDMSHSPTNGPLV